MLYAEEIAFFEPDTFGDIVDGKGVAHDTTR
jgi:hypothetical protein